VWADFVFSCYIPAQQDFIHFQSKASQISFQGRDTKTSSHPGVSGFMNNSTEGCDERKVKTSELYPVLNTLMPREYDFKGHFRNHHLMKQSEPFQPVYCVASKLQTGPCPLLNRNPGRSRGDLFR